MDQAIKEMSETQEKALALKRRYARYGQHTGTKYALDAARKGCADCYKKFDWRDGHNHPTLSLATFDRAPFNVTVSLVHDEYPDLSWIGEFSDTWSEGAVEVALDEQFNEPRHGYKYFIPAFPECRNLDWRLMKSICAGDAIPCDLKVEVYRAGVSLATNYLGGGLWEYGQNPEEVFEDIGCQIDEACDEASQTLLDLCPA